MMDEPSLPLSAHRMWLKSSLKQIRSENPGLKDTELDKKVAKLWRTVDKSVWEEKAAKAKAQYEKDLKAYKAHVGGGDGSGGKRKEVSANEDGKEAGPHSHSARKDFTQNLEITSRSEEESISRWLEGVDTDPSDKAESDPEDGLVEEDWLEESQHDTDTEQEGNSTEPDLERCMISTHESDLDSDDNIPLSSLGDQYYTSKNGTKWWKTPYPITRTRTCNILTERAGPKDAAKNAKSELECFGLYFDQSVIEILVNSTNIYIEHVKSKFSRDRDAKLTDSLEIKAFLGMLFVMGVHKSGRRNMEDFWNTTRGTGTELIYLVMSLKRFRFLLRAIRFDNIRDIDVRKQHDKLAPVRDIFEKLVANYQKHFVPGEYMTLDEQLVAFRGRCPFRQHIPNKPAKYGIKIFLLSDAKVPYSYNMEIYAGAQPPGPYEQSNKVVDIMNRMLTPANNSSRNVTMDNWFTNIEQCTELLSKKITVVGTLKKNNPEIPESFKLTKHRCENDSIFGFQKEGTLVSYVPKENKVVLMYSSMHYDGNIDLTTGEKRKPEIITFYNKTKYGVDLVDKMCGSYDVSRNSRRWPLTVFFDMMNISAINGYVVYTINKGYSNKPRKDYLYEIGFHLVAPCIKRRITVESIPKSLKIKGKLLLGLNDPSELNPGPAQPSNTGRVGKCSFCGRARNKSTRKLCYICNRWICPDHQVLLCPDCAKNEEMEVEDMTD